jgi:hypothetical protein
MGTVSRKRRPPETAEDMLSVMARTIQRLEDDEVSPAVANSIISGTSTWVRIRKTQMEYAKVTGRVPNLPAMLPSGD